MNSDKLRKTDLYFNNLDTSYYLRSENRTTMSSNIVGCVTYSTVNFKGKDCNIFKVSNIMIDFQIYSRYVFCFEI